jgi:hypothetical protein
VATSSIQHTLPQVYMLHHVRTDGGEQRQSYKMRIRKKNHETTPSPTPYRTTAALSLSPHVASHEQKEHWKKSSCFLSKIHSRIKLCMSHHLFLHPESFQFCYGGLVGVKYRRRSRKLPLHPCCGPQRYLAPRRALPLGAGRSEPLLLQRAAAPGSP